MAHESFEDPATAALMNEKFVNIKVDREERPDLDRIYQTAHQVMNQAGGGWPLTMFLAPDSHRPFFSGTYFPPEQRYGMPGFRTVLEKVDEFYRSRRGDLQEYGDKLVDVLGQLQPPADTTAAALSREPLLVARATLQREFDGNFGGFGEAPKFPHPANLEFLLRTWRASAASEEPDLQALYMATLTLTRMAEGGIYDQLGGGFCRYSVDPYWMIPHFEKMLYDNAQLLGVYAQACHTQRASHCSGASRRKRPTGCCAICARPKADSIRPSMPIRKGTKASSMSGRRTRFATCSSPCSTRRSRAGLASIARPISKAGGTCMHSSRSPTSPLNSRSMKPRLQPASTKPACSCSPHAMPVSGRDAT